MLMLLFKVSLTVSFMPREEYIVGNFALTNACPTRSDSEGRTQINEKAHCHPQTHFRTLWYPKGLCLSKDSSPTGALATPLLPEALWAEALRSSFSVPFLLFSLSFLLWTEMLLTDCPNYSYCAGFRCHQKNELEFQDEYAAPSDVFSNLTFLLFFFWCLTDTSSKIVLMHWYLWYSDTWAYCVTFKFG